MRKPVKTYDRTVVMPMNQNRQRGLDHSMPISGSRGKANYPTGVLPGFTKHVTNPKKT